MDSYIPKIEIKDKWLLTVEEAALYSHIGEKLLRELITQDSCPFALRVRSKYLIKRVLFEKWLNQQKTI